MELKRYECNIHTGRYLEELIQNIKETYWAPRMRQFLFCMHNTRKIAIQYRINNFDKQKIKEYEKEYDAIFNNEILFQS